MPMIKSKYAGTCKVCSKSYRRGDLVMWSKGKGAAHGYCAETPIVPDITYKRLSDGYLELSFPYNATALGLVKSLPSRRWDNESKTWTVPDDAKTWDVLGEYMEESGDTTIKLKKVLDVSEKDSHPDYPYLMKHQARIVNTAVAGHRKLYLGLPAGAGKSLASFASIDALDAYPLLIVCLSINKVNWQRELKKFAGLESRVLESRTPSSINENIVIINYDILESWLPELKRRKFKGIIFDESAFIKNPKAKRTKASIEIAKNADSIMLLSGTPTPSSPHDLIPPLTILGQIKKYGGNNKYIKRYCPPVQTKYGISYSNYTNLSELHQNLKNTCFVSWKKEDLVDLPPLFVYDEFVSGESVSIKELLQEMREATMSAANAVIRDMDSDNGMFAKMRSEAGKEKIKSIISEAEAVAEYEKVIVGVHHREVNDEVTKALSKKFKTVQIIGGMDPKKRQKAVDDFQDGDAQVLVMSIVAGGVAINLQNASHMIVGELPVSYADFDQLISRIYRAGQKNKVTVKRMIAPGTVDDILVGLISKKEGLHKSIMAGEDSESVNIKEELARYLVERKKEELANKLSHSPT